MDAILITDPHWGDSGKGKETHWNLTRQPTVSKLIRVNARFNGMNNAGHTVVDNGVVTKLHGLPSSIVCNHVDSFIGPMAAINIRDLLQKEMPEVRKSGADFKRLVIAQETFVSMPWHAEIERLEEAALGANRRDTTLKGVAPTYRDIIGRYGIRVGDLLNRQVLEHKIAENLAVKELMPAIKALGWTVRELTEEYTAYGEALRCHVVDMDAYMEDTFRDNNWILQLEGAQGRMLDRESPDYPNTTASGVTIHDANKIYYRHNINWIMSLGVCKAYTTAVGIHAMPTRVAGEVLKRLRERGREKGTTTGRDRDCAWFDGVVLKDAVAMNQLTHISVMKLDVLDEEPEIQICTGYTRCGAPLSLPPRIGLGECEAVYETLPGWRSSTFGVTRWRDLPENAKRFCNRISEIAERPLYSISTGPETAHTISTFSAF